MTEARSREDALLVVFQKEQHRWLLLAVPAVGLSSALVCQSGGYRLKSVTSDDRCGSVVVKYVLITWSLGRAWFTELCRAGLLNSF